jgi:hypothetical protein
MKKKEHLEKIAKICIGICSIEKVKLRIQNKLL